MTALILLAALGGCGFQLRGTVEIPRELNPMYLEGGSGDLRAAILQRLEFSAVQMASQPKEARILIRILGESRGSRVVAVDRNGKEIASELNYRVTFDAVAPDGGTRVPGQSFDLRRTYENTGVEVLGKESEATLIYQDLTQEAADYILGRLRAALL